MRIYTIWYIGNQSYECSRKLRSTSRKGVEARLCPQTLLPTEDTFYTLGFRTITYFSYDKLPREGI